MELISTFLSNSDWLFDGAGVFVVSAIVTAITQWSRKRKANRHRSGDPLYFEQIIDQIDKVPSIQQVSAWKNYYGLPVRIQGRLVAVMATANDHLQVDICCRRLPALIRFSISRTQCPNLALAEHKAKIVVVGKLEQAASLIVLTDIATIELP